MLRPSPEPDRVIVPAAVESQLSKSRSGVCAACGATYALALSDGEEGWLCPRCGPPSLQFGKDWASSARRRRRRLRLPRLTIPLGFVQLLTVLLSFSLFLALIIRFMDKQQLRDPAVRSAQDYAPNPMSDLPRDPIVRHSQDAVANGQQAQLLGTGQPAASEQPTTGMTYAARLAGSLPTEGTITVEDVPQPVAEHSLTARQILAQSPQSPGGELRMQCRLVKIHHDAVGQVPRTFNVREQRVELSDEDEASFVRLEVLDVQGETFDRLFAATQGPLEQPLRWLRPGDWLLMTASPGGRFDRSSSDAYQGLVVTHIEALSANQHQTSSGPAKIVAGR